MGKKTKESVAADLVATLTLEEFQKLTPEEQAARFSELVSANQALADQAKAAADDLDRIASENEKISQRNAALEKEVKKDELPTIEGVEKDGDIEAGDYQFTAPTFTWDDGSVVNVRELMADAESSDEKVSSAAQVIIAKLLQRKSGILRRKED